MKYKQLIEGQRYQIQALLQESTPKWRIAELVGVHISSIYREIKRNHSSRGYSARKAQDMCNLRKERFGRNRKFNSCMEKLISRKMTLYQWSPEQIVGYCRLHNIHMVSTERIYQFVRHNKFNGGDLWEHTRHKLKSRKRSLKEHKVRIKGRVPITERPKLVDKRLRIGDWETDTIIGKNQQGAILTLTERKTGFLRMVKLESGRQAKALAKQMVSLLIPYKKAVHTITSDNGTEFAEHKYISRKLNADFYFAEPYSAWQRGTNENTNGLIRQYITKGSDFNRYDADYIRLIQNRINRRPRKRLGFKTPSEVFYASLE